MKKIFFSLLTLALLSSCAISREIACDTTDEHGGHLRITSANYLFSGCQLRLGEYTLGNQKHYGLEFDIEDRIISASKGDLLTIYLEDGSKVVLKNLENAKSEVTEHVEEETETHMYTDFVPVYSHMYDAVVAVPYTGTYTTRRPVVRQDSFVKLYYVISLQDMNRIINGKVDHITLATDRDPIEANAHRMPKILKEVSTLFL